MLHGISMLLILLLLLLLLLLHTIHLTTLKLLLVLRLHLHLRIRCESVRVGRNAEALLRIEPRKECFPLGYRLKTPS